MATMIRLTDAQVSALECAGLDLVSPDEPELMVLATAWKGARLEVTDETRDALFTALTDRSNAEDAQAEHQNDALARRAARSLQTLASRVLKGN